MARARNLKPGFFKNEFLNTLSMEARLLFAGLWTLADREGRLEDRPLRIKMELFPLDTLDVNDLLSELHNSVGEFIKRYEVDGQKYIQILNFKKHQNPHHRENPSVIPGMPEQGTAKPEASPEKVRRGRAESLLLNPESLTHESGNVRDEVLEFAKKGLDVAVTSGNPNIQNWAWVEGYLTLKAREFLSAKPELPISEILRLWQACCTLASSKTVSSAKWYQTVFESEVSKWHPKAKGIPSAALPAKKPHVEVVFEAIGNGKRLNCKSKGQIFNADQLKSKPHPFAPKVVLVETLEEFEPNMFEVLP